MHRTEIIDIDVRTIRAEHQSRHPGSVGAASGDEWSDEEREFHQVIERYKQVCSRPFPNWSEVLALLVAMGYRRVAPAAPTAAASADVGPAVQVGGRRRARLEQLAAEGRCSHCGQGAAEATGEP